MLGLTIKKIIRYLHWKIWTFLTNNRLRGSLPNFTFLECMLYKVITDIEASIRRIHYRITYYWHDTLFFVYARNLQYWVTGQKMGIRLLTKQETGIWRGGFILNRNRRGKVGFHKKLLDKGGRLLIYKVFDTRINGFLDFKGP